MKIGASVTEVKRYGGDLRRFEGGVLEEGERERETKRIGGKDSKEGGKELRDE